MPEQGRRVAGGQLFLVGIGPGLPDHLTRHAVDVLQRCSAIVGYQLYVDQVRSWLGVGVRERSTGGPRFLSSPITAERERATQAVALAEAGETVALISSGDAGIYGMAGLAFEVLEERGWDGRSPAVEVVPGVSAAQAAAAVLGAPLMSDYAAISLSDLLTPWDVIERRIAAVAAADLVVALYNPVSRRRRDHLRRAARLIAEHRGADAPVGIVRNALRAGQSVAITRLGCLASARTDCDVAAAGCPAGDSETFCIPHSVDMLSLVVIGNSATVEIAGRLVTRRGYQIRGSHVARTDD